MLQWQKYKARNTSALSLRFLSRLQTSSTASNNFAAFDESKCPFFSSQTLSRYPSATSTKSFCSCMATRRRHLLLSVREPSLASGFACSISSHWEAFAYETPTRLRGVLLCTPEECERTLKYNYNLRYFKERLVLETLSCTCVHIYDMLAVFRDSWWMDSWKQPSKGVIWSCCEGRHFPKPAGEASAP